MAEQKPLVKPITYTVTVKFGDKIVGQEERTVEGELLLTLKRERNSYIYDAISKLAQKAVSQALKEIDAVETPKL